MEVVVLGILFSTVYFSVVEGSLDVDCGYLLLDNVNTSEALV
jgi:hypothetical protein